MGASKDGGYSKISTETPGQTTFLDELLQTINQNISGASQGFNDILSGQGLDAIRAQANRNFQQNSIPAILASVGGEHSGSSALNGALANSAANLNQDLAAKEADLKFQAAQGLGNLGINQGQIGSQSRFALAPQQRSFGQEAATEGIKAAPELLNLFKQVYDEYQKNKSSQSSTKTSGSNWQPPAYGNPQTDFRNQQFNPQPAVGFNYGRQF